MLLYFKAEFIAPTPPLLFNHIQIYSKTFSLTLIHFHIVLQTPTPQMDQILILMYATVCILCMHVNT